jgi:hypothetical protein
MIMRLLLFVGLGFSLIVVLAHIAGRFRVFPGMSWGLPDSPGDYLDLTNAVAGAMSLLAALVLWIAARPKRGLS